MYEVSMIVGAIALVCLCYWLGTIAWFPANHPPHKRRRGDRSA